MATKTKGEELFETYLAERGLSFEFAPALGKACPDYLVHMPSGDILCEVEDFGEGDIDRDVKKQLKEKGFATSGGDPYKRIREKLDVSSRQLREYKNQHPCVTVLHNPGSHGVDLDTETVQGAMFGDITYVFSVGKAGSQVPKDTRVVFAPRRAKLRPNQNTTLSAVAILECYQPNRDLIEKAMDEFYGSGEASRLADRARWERALKIIEDLKSKNLDIDFEQEVIRLRVIHNFNACKALNLDAFAGPHDEQFLLDLDTGKFKRCVGGGSRPIRN